MRLARGSMVCTLVLFVVFLLIGLALLIPGALLVAKNPISFGSELRKVNFDDDFDFDSFGDRTHKEATGNFKFVGGCALIVFGVICLIVSIVMGSCAAGFATASRSDK